MWISRVRASTARVLGAVFVGGLEGYGLELGVD